MLPPADPPASLPRVRQHRRHPQDGTESKLIYKKKKGKEKKIYRKLLNRRKVPRCRGGETGTRGTKGLAGGTENRRRALGSLLSSHRDEEGTAGTRGTAIWGAELSTSCHQGVGTPPGQAPVPSCHPKSQGIPHHQPRWSRWEGRGDRGTHHVPLRRRCLSAFLTIPRFKNFPFFWCSPLRIFRESGPGGGHTAPRALSSSTTYHRNSRDVSPPNRHTLTSTTQETFKNTKLTFRGNGVTG